MKRERKNIRKRQPQPQPQLPIEFMNLIKNSVMAIGEVVSDGILVIQKKLTESDVNLDLNRFTIPANQILNKFLNDKEEDGLKLRKKNGKAFEYISLMFVEPRCQINALDLKRFVIKNNKKNKSAEKNVCYILTTRWKLILKDEENKLKAGAIVQLWAVRVGENLWLVLVRLPNGQDEEGNNSGNVAGSSIDHSRLTRSRPPPPPEDFISFRNKSHVIRHFDLE